MRLLSFLLAALACAPSFGAPVEAVRLQSPTVVSAPAAAAVAGAAVLAPALSPSFSAPSLSAPSFTAAAIVPSAAAAPAPALASEALPAAASAERPGERAGAAEARGPPAAASPRSSQGVAASVAATVRSWGAPIEDIFAKHDVLLVGENHGSLDSVHTLTREMPRLAAVGVKTLGIEGLKKPHQAQVDAYVSGRSDVLPDDALGFSPRRKNAFRELLQSAREHGVRVVALGLPLDQWATQTAALAASNTGRPVSDFGGSATDQFERATVRYDPGYNEAVAEVYLTRRNKSMAALLLDAMKPGEKAVVLVGQAHVDGLDMVPGRLLHVPGAWGTLASELAAATVKAFSLTQTGGLFIDSDALMLDKLARPESYEAASKASPGGRPVYQELGPDRGLWHAGGRSLPIPAR